MGMMDAVRARNLALGAIGACGVVALGVAAAACAGPVTAAGVAGVLAGGVAGNEAQAWLRKHLGALHCQVEYAAGLPSNHDYARGIRTAQRRALERVLHDWQPTDEAETEFKARALGACGRLTEAPALREALTTDLGAAVQGFLADPLPGSPQGERAAMLAAYVEDAVLEELDAAAGAPPAAFVARFRGPGEAGRACFLDAYGAHVAEALKTDTAFQAIFVAGGLAGIEGLAVDTAEGMARLEAQFGGFLTILARVDETTTATLGAVRDLEAAMPAIVQAAVTQALAERGVAPAAAAPQAAEIARLSAENDLTRGAVETFLKDIGAAGAEPAEYAARFGQIAGRYRALLAEAERRTNLPAAQEAERARARDAILAGDLDAAEAILRGLEARIAAVRREQQEVFEQSCRDEAGVKAERAALAKTRLRHREAAALYEEAAGLLGFDAEAAWARLMEAGIALYDQGAEFGENAALVEAIALYDRALVLAPRSTRARDWARTQNNLGIALQTLGARESGTARLEQAVAAYRAALEERTRKRAPLDWAITQNNLGNALTTLGERESGTARLEEAVAAYRAALEEHTREQAPLGWATTQNNLGNALATLGARESGTARLEEAVAAFRAALEEYTRERVPLDWAMTQNNLGAALQTLGARESGTARLEEAVAAYRAALEERTRERVPLSWAMTQNNIGNALQTLGTRESGTARLEAAVAAYRAALEERTRERVPLDWATPQNNLGAALATLGARESGTARLEEAVAAYRAALEERTRARAPYSWAQTKENLAIVGEVLAERGGGMARLAEALRDVEAALEEYQRAGASHDIGTAAQLRDRLRARLGAAPGGGTG